MDMAFEERFGGVKPRREPPHRRAAAAAAVRSATSTPQPLAAITHTPPPKEASLPIVTDPTPIKKEAPANSSSPPPALQSTPAEHQHAPEYTPASLISWSLPEERKSPLPSPAAEVALPSRATSPAPLSPTPRPNTKPSLKYTPKALRGIEAQCGNRLPPASAVQAMFLYELQREEEKEKLFQQQIFQLARHEADATTQASRINAIEGRLTQAEKHQRQLQQLKPEIVANTANVAAQQEQLGACPARLVVVEEALGKIQAQLTALKETQDEQARAASAAAASPPVAPSSPTANKLDVVKQEIDVLFSDRTGILRMIDNLKESLDALNTKLDSVMVQKKNNPSPSPNLQRVRLTTNDGGLVDLGVPKGMSYISTNGGRHVEPGSIKSFSPGKQWAT